MRIAQDDYDNCEQVLLVFYSNGTVGARCSSAVTGRWVVTEKTPTAITTNGSTNTPMPVSTLHRLSLSSIPTLLEEEVRENVALEVYFLRPDTCSLEGIEQISLEFSNVFLTENRVVRAVTEKFENLSLQFQQFAVVRSRIKNFGFDGTNCVSSSTNSTSCSTPICR